MYGLPISTEIKKQLPKRAIYKKFELKLSQRESFDSDIARLDIVAVISTATLPTLAVGEHIKEFYIVAVQMKRKQYDAKNIVLLTKLIPQKMVLALQYENEVQFAVFHTRLITSSWQFAKDAMLPLMGLNVDVVWENIVKGIGQINIEGENTLAEQIVANEQRSKILSQIASIERKIAAEKQPRKKIEYFEMIKDLKNRYNGKDKD
mgnify:CR=1 FL=1